MRGVNLMNLMNLFPSTRTRGKGRGTNKKGRKTFMRFMRFRFQR